MNSALKGVTATSDMRWDIQVLRGVAVLWVLLHHAQLPFVTAGYLGVDIFFVISGYLITGLVARALEQGRFSFAEFYWRRARRLLPAAWVMLALTAIVAPWVLNSLEQQDFERQLLGTLTFSSNWVLWQQTGYFQGAADLKPLLHCWSLSLEEQYYLVLPALLVFTPARHRFKMMLALTGLSMAVCLLWQRKDPAAAFYLLPSRAWELGLGSLAALAGARLPAAWLRPLVWPAALLLVLLPVFPLGPVHPGPSALLICLATLVLLCQVPPLAQAPIALRPFAWLGDISYSLYLLHWPILAFINSAWLADAHDPAGAARLMGWRLGGLVLAVWLSVLMARYVETPPRRLAMPRAHWRSVGAAVLLASAGLLALPWVAGAIQSRGSPPGADYAELRRPNHGLSPACDHEGPFNANPACRHGEHPRWLVWGDSFAMHVVPGLVVAAGDQGLAQATKSSCGPFVAMAPLWPERPDGETFARPWSGQCKAFNDSMLAWLAKASQVDTVILSSLLTQYLEHPGALMLRWDASGHESQTSASVDAMLQATRETVQALRSLGKRVLLMAPPPSADFDIGACAERQALHRWTLGAPASCEIERSGYEARRAVVLSFLRRAESELDLPVLRFDPALCDAQACRTQWQGELLYRDGMHLSVTGSRLLGQQLDWARQVPLLAR